jgi:transcriptional regulator with XRE-family HTH domain
MTNQTTSQYKRLLASKLKMARKSAGLTQEQAAEFLHKTQSFMSKAEAGQRRIHISQLRDFARIYKKGIEFFIK